MIKSIKSKAEFKEALQKVKMEKGASGHMDSINSSMNLDLIQGSNAAWAEATILGKDYKWQKGDQICYVLGGYAYFNEDEGGRVIYRDVDERDHATIVANIGDDVSEVTTLVAFLVRDPSINAAVDMKFGS
ncbi:hypothetical protein ACFO72_004568 [Enterobacter roggenkampii]